MHPVYIISIMYAIYVYIMHVYIYIYIYIHIYIYLKSTKIISSLVYSSGITVIYGHKKLHN